MSLTLTERRMNQAALSQGGVRRYEHIAYLCRNCGFLRYHATLPPPGMVVMKQCRCVEQEPLLEREG